MFLGAGAAIVAVFHDRIASVELGKDGIKLDLDSGGADGGGGARHPACRERRAAEDATVAGLDRYLRAVASRRERWSVRGPTGAATAGFGSEQAVALADRIADDLV